MSAFSSESWRKLWFTPDGCEVWVYDQGRIQGWEIVEDIVSDIARLESLDMTLGRLGEFPWQSPHNCEVTSDGWIVNSRGEQLLWLPHHWQSHDVFSMTWGGKFLVLQHYELSEVVILELDV